MKYYSIGEFAELTGKTIQTLRNWDKNNVLKPHHKAASGFRYYSQEQLNHFFGLKNSNEQRKRKIIGYCRVSNNKQKNELEKQIETIKSYMIAKGYSFDIITDIGSGINYNKRGLNLLLELISMSEVEKIVILYKDILVQFGFELIQNMCNQFNTVIEIIDNTAKTEEQELVEELIQIVTVFSYKLESKKVNKAKKVIKELLEINKE